MAQAKRKANTAATAKTAMADNETLASVKAKLESDSIVPTVESVIETETETETPTVVQFDNAAFRELMESRVKAVADRKASATLYKLQIGKLDVQLPEKVFSYFTKSGDSRPLASYLHNAKPTGIAKRVCQQALKNGESMIHAETKVLHIIKNGPEWLFDDAKIMVLMDTAKAGDSIDCEQMKAAFPKAETSDDVRMASHAKSLQSAINSGKLTKAQIATVVQGLS